MMRILGHIFALMLMCCMGTVNAATYFVAPGGNDNNNGSTGSPWATIQNFGNVAQAGDTLTVRAGTYAGFIFGWDGPNEGRYSRIVGTQANPIIIQADPAAAPGTVIINDRNVHQANAIDLEPGCNYVNLIGFTVTDPSNRLTKCGIACLGCTGNQLLNLTVNGSSGVGGILVDNGTNVLIQNNTCMNVLGTNTKGHGMYLSGSSLNCIIRGNTIRNNQTIGLHINGDASEGGAGVVRGALIENNFIFNNGHNAINADGLQNSIIRNNLIYGYQRSGIVLYRIDASGGGINNVIVNNIIANPQAGAQAALRFVDGSSGNKVFNNVLLSTNNRFLAASANSLTGLVMDYNVVSSTFENDDTGSTLTLAQWRTQSGNDTHSFTSTNAALFVNAAGGDYHSFSNSPAINTGIASLSAANAPAVDLENNPRPSGSQYDIGCYEVQTSAALAITTASPLPQGTIGATYTTSFAASGGTPGYTFTVSAGTAPTGLTLNAAGTLSGTPTGSAGSSTFTVQVTDGSNATATKQFQLTINAAPAISTTTLAQGSVGASYSQTLAASGGTPPLTWSVTGTLPTGLSLNANSGAITGTPTAAGAQNLTFRVTDARTAFATKALVLTINAAPAITTTTLPQGVVGDAYNQTLAASGGTAPFTWSVTSGTLPAGISLNANTGALTGTPTAAGNPNITFRVADAVGASATKALTLTINGALAITSNSPLPVATVGLPYTQTLAASGGIQAYTWSVASGTLPTGITLSTTGVLSGTPTGAGTFTFGLQVADNAAHTATKSFSVTVNVINITTASLPAGTVGTVYTQTLAAAGGATPYAWSVSAGALPDGLTLSNTGVLSGTPTVAGAFNATVRVADTNVATATKAFAITINPLLVLTSITVTPANAIIDIGETRQFSATGLDQFGNPLGAQPAITWSVDGGSINAAGLFTGNAGGTFTVTAASGNISGTASIRVNAPPVITSGPTASALTVLVNTPVDFSAAASDPNGGPVTTAWTFGDGTGAPGTSVSHGYAQPGIYTVTVRFSDEDGDITIATLAISVELPPTTPMTVTKLSGSMKFKFTGRDAYAIKGLLPQLPAGLVLAGQPLTLGLSGANVSFTLDKNGRARNAQGSFMLKLPLKRVAGSPGRVFIGGDGSYTASLRNGVWAEAWGFVPTVTATKQTKQMTATINFNGVTYAQTLTITYSQRAGVGGSFKK